jgi:hypothetical protein
VLIFRWTMCVISNGARNNVLALAGQNFYPVCTRLTSLLPQRAWPIVTHVSTHSSAYPFLAKQRVGKQKITFGEMREMGVRGLLVYCSDYHCSRYQAEAAEPLSGRA